MEDEEITKDLFNEEKDCYEKLYSSHGDEEEAWRLKSIIM
jgi:hypothetical protein